MFLKTFLFYFQKIRFFYLRKIKGNNVKNRPPDHFFKRKILTPGAMKTHFQISNKESKSEGRRCVKVQGLSME